MEGKDGPNATTLEAAEAAARIDAASAKRPGHTSPNPVRAMDSADQVTLARLPTLRAETVLHPSAQEFTSV
jgi:hypothetical protein